MNKPNCLRADDLTKPQRRHGGDSYLPIRQYFDMINMSSNACSGRRTAPAGRRTRWRKEAVHVRHWRGDLVNRSTI
jgi:hypothetical protein